MGYPKQPGQDAEAHRRLAERSLEQAQEINRLREERDALQKTCEDAYSCLLMGGWWYPNDYNGQRGQGEALPSARDVAALRSRLAWATSIIGSDLGCLCLPSAPVKCSFCRFLESRDA